MKYIFLISAFQAFFFAVLTIQKRPRSLHDNILVVWLIYLGSFIAAYSFYSHKLFTDYRLLSISLITPLLLHGPFLYVYVKTLVSGNKTLALNDFVHIAPFILFNLYILFSSFDPAVSERLSIERISKDFDPPLVFIFFLVLTVTSGTFYFLLTLKLFRKLDINIFNNFSSSSHIDLDWLRKLVLVFGIVWTILISVTIIHHVFHWFSSLFCTDGLFLSLSLFVITMGYFGLKQKQIFSSDNIILDSDTLKNKPRYSGSRLNDVEAQNFAGRVTSHMNSAKPFLDPELTLPGLATELGMSTHTLSQVINDQFGVNFFDFVNGYRVEAFKEKIKNPDYKNFSLLGIALDCGFNSKSAFNRIFKKATGFTPSQYKESATTQRSI